MLRLRAAIAATAITIVALAAFLAAGQQAHGGTVIEVDSDDDEVAIDGRCSLRQAVFAANFNVAVDTCASGSPGMDTIHVAAGNYLLSAGPGGRLDIDEDVQITGEGPEATIIEADHEFTAFKTGTDVTAEFAQLAITNGSGFCGGILAGGDLTLTGVRMEGNTATNNGGGVCGDTDHSLTVIDSSFINNSAGSSGGGLYTAGDLTVRGSTFTANEATLVGGGLTTGSNVFGGTAVITNSTFSSNNSNVGGGISSQPASDTSLLNVTITENTAGTGGSAIQDVGPVTVQNSIIDGTCGDVTSLGNNIFTDIGGCDASAIASDIVTANPGLGPLHDNGGPTLTHRLDSDSPAVDAADDAACPEVDQRGEDRPRGGGCDIGAFESTFTAPSPTPTASPGPGTSTPTLPPNLIQGDVDCNGVVELDDFELVIQFAASVWDGVTSGECPDLGFPEQISGQPWGDVNCDDAVDALDALYVLAYVADAPLQTPGGCFAVGGIFT